MIKTCGNCGNPCGRENCGFWEPNNEVLEQRYEHLAEVALDMLESLDDTCRFCSHRECMQFGCSEAYNNAHNHFKAQLEELGVEL